MLLKVSAGSVAAEPCGTSTGYAQFLRLAKRWGWKCPNSFRMAGEEKSSSVEQKGAERLFARSSNKPFTINWEK